MRKAAGTWLNL